MSCLSTTIIDFTNEKVVVGNWKLQFWYKSVWFTMVDYPVWSVIIAGVMAQKTNQFIEI